MGRDGQKVIARADLLTCILLTLGESSLLFRDRAQYFFGLASVPTLKRSRDELTHCRRELLLRRAPTMWATDPFVAQNASEAPGDPYRNIEHRPNPQGLQIVFGEFCRTRIGVCVV